MPQRSYSPPDRPSLCRRILRMVTQLTAGAILAAITIAALHLFEALR